MYIFYKNSFLASVVSIVGCVFFILGIEEFSYGFEYGLPYFIAAVPFLIGGKIISNNKAFKKWWKQVEQANLVPEIVRSNQTALDIYNKNPQKRTLKKIAVLNPEAAALIEQSLATKKK